MSWTIKYLLPLVLSIIISLIAQRSVAHIAYRRKIFDSTNARKMHTGMVPRLGGLAFLPTVLLSLCICLFVWVLGGDCLSVFELRPNGITKIIICGIAFVIVYLTGLWDDFLEIGYKQKFVLQLAAALFLVSIGIRIDDLCGIFGIHEIPWYISWPLSAIAVVFIINSFNLIDGIDGLASSLAILTFLFYGMILIMADIRSLTILCIILAGTLIGFSYFNIFGKTCSRNKIFMGDTGSMTTAMAIASTGIIILHADTSQNPEWNMVVVLSPMLIPYFDAFRVMFTRILHSSNPFLPDCNHIHHKFIKSGISQRKTLYYILTEASFLIAINLLLIRYLNINIVLLIDIALYILFIRMIRKPTNT